MIEDYQANEEFEIIVQFEWIGSPRRDFTVMVYSADGNDVTDDDGDTNMLHADGQTPSEFDYIAETFPDGRVADDEPSSGGRFDEGYTGCMDTNGEATDSYGDGCDWYLYEHWCGGWDDSDFETSVMCCTCGGGCIDEAVD